MTTEKLILSILVLSIVTFSTRAFPFLIFGQGKEPHPTVLYLGKFLPPAIICIIIVYSLVDTTVLAYPYALPEIISILTVVILHLKFKNSMLSISLGTVLYMFLIQFMFA